MWRLRKMRLHCVSVAWLMVVTVVLLTLAPHHYHLHHGSDPGALHHPHTIDLHILSDVRDGAHHDEATALKASPDGLVKSVGDNPLKLLFVATLLGLLPIPGSEIRRRFGYTLLDLRQAFDHLTPPLRAPPVR
jgi:hypothetical protein